MAKGTNDFGGKSDFLYIPLTEIEQEFISRLVELGEIMVVIHGFGSTQPRVTFGDKVLHAHIKFAFDKAPPAPGVSVPYFDMELRTQSGICLYRQKMPTSYNNTPMLVSNELVLEMVWDIAIKYIDPKLIKMLMPKVTGFTTRLEDKDSHEITVTGNMTLDKDQYKKALDLHKGEQSMKAYDEKKLQEAVKKAK
jgi:hypothetical protein